VLYGNGYEQGREVGQTIKEKLLVRICAKATKKETDNAFSPGTGLWSKKTKSLKVV
jgi:hypothetical protein